MKYRPAAGQESRVSVDRPGVEGVLRQLQSIEQELAAIKERLMRLEGEFTSAVDGGPEKIYMEFSAQIRQILEASQNSANEEIPAVQDFIAWSQGN